ncbi:MAG: hypothetical protein V1492_02515 [Candidatus Micrarchaeota archaeon]
MKSKKQLKKPEKHGIFGILNKKPTQKLKDEMRKGWEESKLTEKT